MKVGPASRPRLAPRARLRLDRRTGQTLLLYPERGLALSTIGQAVLQLCAGDRTVDDIVAVLSEQYASESATVRTGVLSFLQQLADRGLIEEAVS